MYTNIPIWTDNVERTLGNAALTSFDYDVNDKGDGLVWLTFMADVKNLSMRDLSVLQQIAYQAISDFAEVNGLTIHENGSINIEIPIEDIPDCFGDHEEIDEETIEDDDNDYGFHPGRWNPFDRS